MMNFFRFMDSTSKLLLETTTLTSLECSISKAGLKQWSANKGYVQRKKLRPNMLISQ
ncbi:UNVERIFIED_CONTAM: hypothetical protein GTU68_013256 [Idotea baltica]|nr:hypothetical protein [Idotea baltica]